MNSATAVLADIATPSILHRPPDVVSLDAATEAIELGECYGLTLDPDQKATLYAAQGERADGTWAASEVADVKGRQAGKNDTATVRKLAGFELYGERLQLHTAHEFATANEDFLRIVAIYEAYDDLRKKVARIRYANGEQGIEYISGARLKYRARTGGAGRGFAEADVVYYDEFQHLQAEQLAASMPTMLVSRNFQAWFLGSGGLSTSTHARALRLRAILGNGGRLAYTENTAQTWRLIDGRVEFIDPSPESMLEHDVLMLHPGYANGRVSPESMKTMYQAMGPELFAREILCVWDRGPGDQSDGPISLARWNELVDPDSAIVGPVSRAIDVSPDFKWATVAAAGRRADGHLHVEIGCRNLGTEWIVPFAQAQGAEFRVASSAPAGFLIPLLVEAGVKVVEVSAQEVTQACSRLISAVAEGTVHSLGGNELPAAIANATISQRGDAQAWSRLKSSGDISALCAATIAVGGVGESPGLVYAY